MYITKDTGKIFVDTTSDITGRICLNSASADALRRLIYNEDGSLKETKEFTYDDIKNIQDALDTINTSISANASSIQGLTTGLNGLDTRLTTEVTRATEMENALDDKIDAEIQRSTESEVLLDSRIAANSTAISSNKTAHETLAIKLEGGNVVSNEASSFNSNTNTITIKAQLSNTSVEAKVYGPSDKGGELSHGDSFDVPYFEVADDGRLIFAGVQTFSLPSVASNETDVADLRRALNEEIAQREAADSDFVTQLATEAAARAEKDTELDQAIKDEAAAARRAEGVLDDAVAALQTRATTIEENLVKEQQRAEAAENNLVEAAAQASTKADNALAAVETEEQDRIAEIQRLEGLINANGTEIGLHTGRLAAVEGVAADAASDAADALEAIEGITQDMAGLSETYATKDELNTAKNGLNDLIGANADAIDTLNTTTQGHTDTLGSHSERLTAVEGVAANASTAANAAATKTELTKAKNDLTELINANSTEIGKHAGRLTTVEGVAASAASDATKALQDAANAAQDVVELGKITATTEALNAVKDELADSIDENASAINGLNTKATTNETNISTLTGKVNTIIGSDAGKSMNQVADAVARSLIGSLVLNSDGGEIDKLQEIATWINGGEGADLILDQHGADIAALQTGLANISTAAGSATQPVYISGGKPVAISYTIQSSVPANAKFTDTTYGVVSTTANGLAPKLAGGTTKFLRADGTWATPPDTDTNTTYSAGTGLTLSGTTFNHSNSITAGTAGSSTAYTAQWGAGFAVPYITYDAQGHITATGTRTITMPSNPNSDTKVKCTAKASTDTNAYPVLACATASPSSGTAYEAVYSTGVTMKGGVLMGAAWNDYAEYREANSVEAGRVVCENGDDTLSLAIERLQPGASVISDTYGFVMGQFGNAQTPIAVSGRVLAYPFEDRHSYKPGDAVCAAPGGTVSKMSREEIMMYPERIIGTVSAIPEYETWGERNVPVNGRIWIKI